MSRHVADLTAAGLLDRDIDPDDGRTHLVRLTADGEDALQQARELVLGRLAPALDGWTDEELSGLESQLSRLTQDLTAAVGRTPEGTS
jgi:DNA-binding MarR family transcriptional regulator